MKLINKKIVKQRIKEEYETNIKLTSENVKKVLNKIIKSNEYKIKKVELKDDISLFDDGIRKDYKEKNGMEEFINNNLKDEITNVFIWIEYDKKEICMGIELDKNRITTSCKEKIDIKNLLQIFEN
ncbi:MAG: hypothetical protein E7311_04395 [Clostridiales bacterium]|nr:hypothetical protein [Clostridiales bacterium]